MRIKFLQIVIIMLLIFTSINVISVNSYEENNVNISVKNDDILFSEASIKSDGEYTTVDFDEANTYLKEYGKPMLPVFTKTFTFPFGTTITSVDVSYSNAIEIQIMKDIQPAKQSLPKTTEVLKIIKPVKDMEIYSSSELYPSVSNSYTVKTGLNGDERATYLIVECYPVRYSPAKKTIYQSTNADINVKYEKPSNSVSSADEYDMVIIAPKKFSKKLQPLIEHKNNLNPPVRTILKTTESIYKLPIFGGYRGRDKAEKIKYFIKDAIEEWGIKYVLLVGGRQGQLFRWYVPARYANLDDNSGMETKYLSDLYFADIYKDGGEFDDWDSNGNGVFAEWTAKNKDTLDLVPDVYVGRLACRNTDEVKTVVNKIISYESNNNIDEDWFNKVLAVSGDCFQDQRELNIQWDVNLLPNGEYTIYAQSKNKDNQTGLINELTVAVDHSAESSISYSEEDHLTTNLDYPGLPVAEITVPSNGDILGYTDVEVEDPEGSYDGYLWTSIEYVSGVLELRGKSYDPKPSPNGSITDMHIWIENSNQEIIFNVTKENNAVFFEGEKITYEALKNVSDDFEQTLLWTSNGAFTNQQDVIDAISDGCGFLFFSGHGSPITWANHFPGIPGGRYNSQIEGLSIFNSLGSPYFPMKELANDEKLPICIVGGCHNSQFDTTIFNLLRTPLKSFIYSTWITRCWSWNLVRQKNGGSIATIGNTGLGWGSDNEDCYKYLEGWMNVHFFEVYTDLSQQGNNNLGEIYGQTIIDYINEFGIMDNLETKTVQEWVLLGDPSLRIGGYP